MTNGPRSLAELVGMLAAEADDESAAQGITADAALVALRNALPLVVDFNRPDYAHSFTPGMILRPRKGIADGYREPAGGMVMYVRDLTSSEREMITISARDDTDIPADVKLLVASRDVLCARVLPGGDVTCFPTASFTCEVHPDYRTN